MANTLGRQHPWSLRETSRRQREKKIAVERTEKESLPFQTVSDSVEDSPEELNSEKDFFYMVDIT